MLDGRDGELFVLVADLTPALVFDLSDGRTGEDSRDGLGELAADAARLVCSFFVAVVVPNIDDVGGSLVTGCAVEAEAVCSWVVRGAVVSGRSGRSCLVAGLRTGVESMVVKSFFSGAG